MTPPTSDGGDQLGALSALPPDVLRVVLGFVSDEGIYTGSKNHVRSVCKALQQECDHETVSISGRNTFNFPLIPCVLAPFTSLQRLGYRSTEVADLSHIWDVRGSLRHLDCSGTKVVDLGPLAACASLAHLDCRDTQITDLGPLAACASLAHLDCSGTKVVDLGPMAACASYLAHLSCRYTQVVDLGPLSACAYLTHLDCSYIEVLDLGHVVDGVLGVTCTLGKQASLVGVQGVGRRPVARRVGERAAGLHLHQQHPPAAAEGGVHDAVDLLHQAPAIDPVYAVAEGAVGLHDGYCVTRGPFA
jgi:hypothetical protein